MAIIDTLPGVEVTVQVDKEALREYNDVEGERPKHMHPNGHHISKYIEAIDDQEFTILTILRQPYAPDSPSVTALTYIDGQWADGRIAENLTYAMINRCKLRSKGYTRVNGETGIATRYNYKFSRLNISSDDSGAIDVKAEIERVSKIGTIEVKIYRTSSPVVATNKPRNKFMGEGISAEIHEKALKGQAKSHGVSTGASSKVSNKASRVEYIDGSTQPFAIFEFHYRSKEALKQLHVIPRTPEPEDPPSPPRTIKHERSKPTIKRERVDNDYIKPDPEERTSKRKKPSYKVIVDLTIDEDSDVDKSIISID